MADIRPFRAVRYSTNLVGELGKVVTQPYDKISPEMQTRYYESSPYNLVRIILGRKYPADSAADNVYTRATAELRRWLDGGALQLDAEPAIYAYDQEYTVPGTPGVAKIRRGFIALGKIEDYSTKVVHRHEETLSGPKADRLELLKATRAHCEQLFLLYSDPAGKIERSISKAAAGASPESVTDEYGTRHSLLRIDDPAVIVSITAAMRDLKLVIADGHHRYETALAYRDFYRAQGQASERTDYVMMTFIRKESEGLTILPTHRVVHSLPYFDWNSFLATAAPFFNVTPLQETGAAGTWAGRYVSSLAEAGRAAPVLGAFGGPGKLALLKLHPDVRLVDFLPDVPEGLRRLDVVLLHRLVLDRLLGIDRQAVREERNIHYVRGAEDALGQAGRGTAQVSFLMNPTPIASVWDNALAGQPLPQKSTDFHPKLLSGLTMYWLDNPLGM